MPDESQERLGRGWSTALIVLCLAIFWLQCAHIARTLPYPRDIDEGFVSGPAQRTLTTGTFHPYRFTYPSLPKYLAAIGMGAGFLRAATHLEVNDIQKLGNVGYPYYDTPRAVAGARQLFALLSVVALAATGIIAWQLQRSAPALLIAPALVALSPLFVYHSWSYLNVDIVALCFSTATLAACLLARRRPTLVQAAIIPGVYAGLATGSKYTMAVIIVPVLVTIGLYLPPGRRMWSMLAALVAMVLAFLAVVPYSLIDLPGFLSGVALEAFHYANGHPGAEGDPGLAQVWFYTRHLVDAFGPVAMLLAVVGTASLVLKDWRRAAILLSFPLVLGVLLAGQRVHFERNVLGVYPIVATLSAVGLISVYHWTIGRLSARVGRSPRVALLAALALTLLVVPWWHVPAALRDRTDSRNAAVEWLSPRLPPGTTVLVPTQLAFDTRTLAAGGTRVVAVDLQAAASVDAFQRVLESSGPSLLLLPRWGADARFPGGELAATLNGLGGMLKPVASFGANPILVNYTEPVPWGDPAFGIVPLGGITLKP